MVSSCVLSPMVRVDAISHQFRLPCIPNIYAARPSTVSRDLLLGTLRGRSLSGRWSSQPFRQWVSCGLERAILPQRRSHRTAVIGRREPVYVADMHKHMTRCYTVNHIIALPERRRLRPVWVRARMHCSLPGKSGRFPFDEPGFVSRYTLPCAIDHTQPCASPRSSGSFLRSQRRRGALSTQYPSHPPREVDLSVVCGLSNGELHTVAETCVG